MGASFRGSGSGADEAGDRLGRLAHLLVGLGAAGARRFDDAVAHVLLEQAEGDRLQRLRHRRDLRQDVDAVLLVLDHALKAAGLALDAAEPLEVVVLAADVAVLVGSTAVLVDARHAGPPVRAAGVAATEDYTPRGCPAGGGSVGGQRPSPRSRSTSDRSAAASDRRAVASERRAAASARAS